MKDLKEQIEAWINDEAKAEELVELVANINSYDGSLVELTFYWMDTLNELFYGVKPTELLEKLDNNFNVMEDGFRDNGILLESCSLMDASQDIRDNAEEVVEALLNEFNNIDLPTALENYLEEIDLEEE